MINAYDIYIRGKAKVGRVAKTTVIDKRAAENQAKAELGAQRKRKKSYRLQNTSLIIDYEALKRLRNLQFENKWNCSGKTLSM